MDFSESVIVRGGQCSVTPGRVTAKLCSAKVVGGAPGEPGTHPDREWNHIEFCGILPSRIVFCVARWDSSETRAHSALVKQTVSRARREPVLASFRQTISSPFSFWSFTPLSIAALISSSVMSVGAGTILAGCSGGLLAQAPKKTVVAASTVRLKVFNPFLLVGHWAGRSESSREPDFNRC